MRDGDSKPGILLTLAPALIFLTATLPHLNQGDWRSDSGWYSAIALQAWEAGHFWTLAAEPGRLYFNKPPLVFWIHGTFLTAIGPTLLAARLPTVLAGLGCVLSTGAIARRFIGPTGGALCASILALSYEFFRRSREVSLDLWQLMFMLFAVLAIVAGSNRERNSSFAISGVFLGLALMCKPLMALAVLPILAIWLAWDGRGRAVPKLLLTLAAALVVAAPWHMSMAIMHGAAFTGQYFGSEVAARAGGTLMGGQFSHEPWWFYFAQIGKGYWPWLLFAVPGLVSAFPAKLPSHRASTLKLGAAWTLGWLLVLTLFPDRRDRYAVPLYPGLALVAGGWLWSRFSPAARALTKRTITIAGPVATLAGIVFALLPIRVQRPPDPQWPALVAWLRDNAPNGVWEGACAGAPAARIYLETGRWPTPARNADDSIIADPPAGSLLLYHRRGGRIPGANESVVFESGDLRVTRLDAQPWQPTKFADPGEQ